MYPPDVRPQRDGHGRAQSRGCQVPTPYGRGGGSGVGQSSVRFGYRYSLSAYLGP